jgi:hypothetical protein
VRKIYLISTIAIIAGSVFLVRPGWFRFLWGWQVLLLPLTAGIFMVLAQDEDRSYRFVPKLIIGSVLTCFIYTFLWQIIEYDNDGNFFFFVFFNFALFLTGVCVFGGLIGIVIRGITLLLNKNKKYERN